MSNPTIVLNGQPHPVENINTIAMLLESLNMSGKPVIIERNGKALLPGEFGSEPVADGDRIEIITIVAGG